MGDFTNPHRQAPIIGQVLPRTVYDLGALITVTGQGAGTILSSTARGNEKNTSSRGVRVNVLIANKSGTIDVVVTIRRYIKAFNAYVSMLASASLTANGTTSYIVHPELTAAANLVAKDFIGEEWDVQVVSGTGSTPSADITVAAEMLP
jgi:hypothetical protein